MEAQSSTASKSPLQPQYEQTAHLQHSPTSATENDASPEAQQDIEADDVRSDTIRYSS
jgi:hypothetical protein